MGGGGGGGGGGGCCGGGDLGWGGVTAVWDGGNGSVCSRLFVVVWVSGWVGGWMGGCGISKSMAEARAPCPPQLPSETDGLCQSMAETRRVLNAHTT